MKWWTHLGKLAFALVPSQIKKVFIVFARNETERTLTVKYYYQYGYIHRWVINKSYYAYVQGLYSAFHYTTHVTANRKTKETLQINGIKGCSHDTFHPW